MAAVFDEAIFKARQLMNIASKKTERAVEFSKLKLQVSQINSIMQSTYERIGTLIYEQEKTGTDNQEIILVCIREIDDSLLSLNEINQRLEELKSGCKCERCGALNSPEAMYCVKCGARLGTPKKN